jgi:hypothetical protein
VILAQALRWLEPLLERRQADIHLQLAGPEAVHSGRQIRHCLRERPLSASSSSMTVAASAKAVQARYINGENVATGRIEQTQCCAFSADEGADVGADEGTRVTEDYLVPFKFTGKIDSDDRPEGDDTIGRG